MDDVDVFEINEAFASQVTLRVRDSCVSCFV